MQSAKQSGSSHFSGHPTSKRLIKMRQNSFVSKGSSHHYQICSFSLVCKRFQIRYHHRLRYSIQMWLSFFLPFSLLLHFAFNLLYFLLDFVFFLFGPALNLDCENWVSAHTFPSAWLLFRIAFIFHQKNGKFYSNLGIGSLYVFGIELVRQ